MASIKQQIRTNQALQVIQYSNDGKSIVEACQEVGIPRSTFYYFVNTHPDAIATFQEMQMLASLEQFALILANQVAILERVIKDGLADTTKPRHRLAIYKELVKRSDELMESLHVSRAQNTGDIDFLNGPTLIQAQSRFSASEVEVRIGRE